MTSVMNKKAVALISDGLDSALAIKLMLDQGIEVIPLHFINPFTEHKPKGESKAEKSAALLGVTLKVIVKGQDFIEMLRNPKHGYGSGINPCIDCRIHLLKAAKIEMQKLGASFIVTGEVIGQRPMSQMRQQMDIIEKKAEVEGILLRPLSAKNLPETIPEQNGVVDREKLLDIQGRSRKRQLAYAKEYNLVGINSGGGGCLLTDKIYAKKVRDIYDNQKDVFPIDYLIMSVGRHFRLNKNTKAALGRNEAENNKLLNFLGKGNYLFEPINFNGPSVLLQGEKSEENIKWVTTLISAYTKPKADSKRTDFMVKVFEHGKEPSEFSFSFKPVEKVTLDPWRIT